MKTTKKLLSVFVVALLVFSCISTAFVSAEDQIATTIFLDTVIRDQRPDGSMFEASSPGLIQNMVNKQLGSDSTPVLNNSGWYKASIEEGADVSTAVQDSSTDYSYDSKYGFNVSQFNRWYHDYSQNPINDILAYANQIITTATDSDEVILAYLYAYDAITLASDPAVFTYDASAEVDGKDIYPATNIAEQVNGILALLYNAVFNGEELYYESSDQVLDRMYDFYDEFDALYGYDYYNDYLKIPGFDHNEDYDYILMDEAFPMNYTNPDITVDNVRPLWDKVFISDFSIDYFIEYLYSDSYYDEFGFEELSGLMFSMLIYSIDPELSEMIMSPTAIEEDVNALWDFVYADNSALMKELAVYYLDLMNAYYEWMESDEYWEEDDSIDWDAYDSTLVAHFSSLTANLDSSKCGNVALNLQFNQQLALNSDGNLQTFTDGTQGYIYTFDSAVTPIGSTANSETGYFPIDSQGFGNFTGKDVDPSNNYHFTMTFESSFQYHGGETFSFTGDDDVWVFINNQLVLDIGGVHGPINGTVILDQIAASQGFKIGDVCKMNFFFAERMTKGSNLKISTSIQFVPTGITPISTPTPDVPNPPTGVGGYAVVIVIAVLAVGGLIAMSIISKKKK